MIMEAVLLWLSDTDYPWSTGRLIEASMLYVHSLPKMTSATRRRRLDRRPSPLSPDQQPLRQRSAILKAAEKLTHHSTRV